MALTLLLTRQAWSPPPLGEGVKWVMERVGGTFGAGSDIILREILCVDLNVARLAQLIVQC